jgi:hypothetical protein
MPTNTLSVYNPQFYANEALIQLEKALGMAGRVHRGYDKAPQQRGQVINIKKPSTFTAQDAPSTAQDIKASSVAISLDYWREVKFALTDKELTYTGEQIVEDHIRPAAYALADDIDQKLCALYKDVPWYADFTASAAVADITNARKILFNNRVPLDEGRMHFMVNGTIEAELLNLAAFTQHSGAGEAGVAAQMRGSLGRRYGFEFFANQNVANHTSATVADLVAQIDNVAGYPAGATSIAVEGLTAAATLAVGDIVVITGHTQQYVLTAVPTIDGTGDGVLSIFPGLEAAVDNDQVTTIVLSGGSGATKAQNLAFHRNAFALAMAPLSTMGNGLGARMAIASDPVTNLALRSRIWYEADDSEVRVALDVLYGVKTLDGNLAARIRD